MRDPNAIGLELIEAITKGLTARLSESLTGQRFQLYSGCSPRLVSPLAAMLIPNYLRDFLLFCAFVLSSEWTKTAMQPLPLNPNREHVV